MIKMPSASNDKQAMFATYARFEFALKEAEFIGGAEGEIARADWPKFAREKVLNDVLLAVSAHPDVAALMADPPKTQIRVGKKFEWRGQIGRPIVKLNDLFLAVKTVRDNLFHGGKAGENPRDDSLCRAAVFVMIACLERHADVRYRFEGKY